MSRRWFRWYEGTTEDGKFRVVARMSRVTVRDVLALWAFILEDAANLDHRGVCKRDEDFMESILDFEDGVVETILAAMEHVDLISVEHGAITICNWGKRQFEGDHDPTSADRQKRKRERDKELSHARVTRDSRPPDTDTDTDTEKKEKKDITGGRSATRPPDDDLSFEEFWRAYPKRKGASPKHPARKKFEALVKSGVPPATIIDAAKLYAAEQVSIGKAGTEFVAQAMTWLNQQRFGDYEARANGASVGYLAAPGSDEFAAWRESFPPGSFRRDEMDRAAEARRAYPVPAQWPPGYTAKIGIAV